MQDIRALALALVALAVTVFPVAAQETPRLEIVNPGLVESYSFEPLGDCGYLLNLTLTEKPITAQVLLNGTVDVTSLMVNIDSRLVTVRSTGLPPAKLTPGAYHEIIINNVTVALVRCPAAHEAGSGTEHHEANSTATGTTRPERPPSPGDGDIRVPPGPVEGESAESAFKSRFHLAISASAGIATLVLVVVDRGRSGEGRGSAEEREARYDL